MPTFSKYILIHKYFIVLLVFFCIGCKKYPDGPLLSLHTREHRVVGKWGVAAYYVNGADSTQYILNSPYYGVYELRSRKHNYEAHYLAIGPYSRNSKWSFEGVGMNEKTKIHIGFSSIGQPGYLAPYDGNAWWEIRRLTEKEMWLKTVYNNKEYLVKFRLIANVK